MAGGGREQAHSDIAAAIGEVRLSVDLPRLQRHLAEHVPELPLARGGPGDLQCSQFGTGTSNPTYLLWSANAPSARCVLRRKPPGQLLVGAHQIDREFRVQKALEGTGVPVPKMHHFCSDDSVLGAPFYVMDCIAGRTFPPVGQAETALKPEERMGVWASLCDAAAALHAVDFRAAGLGDYGKVGNYTARQLKTWHRNFQESVQIVDKALPRPQLIRDMEELYATQLRHASTALTVIRVGEHAVCSHVVSAKPGSGYLSAEAGTHLEILHVGTEGEEIGWAFARKVPGAGSRETGWVATSALRSCGPALQDELPSPAGRAAEHGAPCQSKESSEVHEVAPSAQALPQSPSAAQPPNHNACSMQPAQRAEAASRGAEAAESRGAAVGPASSASGSRAPPSRGTLQLLTFGLENCENELVDRCLDWGGGDKARPSNDELRQALGRLKFPRVDVVLDARRFPDFGSVQLTRHSGVHPEIISRIVRHANFAAYLREVRRLWSEAAARRARERPDSRLELVVAVYCRSGKHRSVAVAECLRHIGARAERLDVEVLHLSKPHWGKNVCKGGCKECQDFSDQRQGALMEAERIWCDLR